MTSNHAGQPIVASTLALHPRHWRKVAAEGGR